MKLSLVVSLFIAEAICFHENPGSDGGGEGYWPVVYPYNYGSDNYPNSYSLGNPSSSYPTAV